MEHDTLDTSTNNVEIHCEREALARLGEELKQTQSKFEEWKVKAKIGVDHLRERIVQLTTQLEVSESQRQALALSLDNLRSSKDGDDECPRGLGIPCTIGCLAALERERVVGESLLTACGEKMEVLWLGLLSHPQRQSPSEDKLELYKRRVATTMKLQQKNAEALQTQVVELQESLRLAEKELQARASGLLAKEETISLLEKRLSSVEQVNEELQRRSDATSRGPNMDRINAMEEKMEQRINALCAEFALHENTIVMQHHDELERLQSTHEREMDVVRQEAEERIAREIEAGLSFPKQPPSLLSMAASPPDDASYGELLKEFEALESQHRALLNENTEMKSKMQKLNSSNEAERVNNGKASSVTCYQHNPSSLAEANVVIQKLQESLTTTTDQLWRAKKGLINGKVNKFLEGALDSQQVAYLKSIIVNLLCMCNNSPTIAKLLPVISKLLQFNKEDMDTIYNHNLDWKRGK
ncbi:unnamed protein product [Phytomonas sp. Hart1]|nr:unnamed protein product [Phytomonas sp. Hart1]|eukprot:CCW67160.1 unnamed protein product [Phytomonas sp. isolate Hart1]